MKFKVITVIYFQALFWHVIFDQYNHNFWESLDINSAVLKAAFNEINTL